MLTPTKRELAWLRRANESYTVTPFFLTGPNGTPRKGFAKGWPTQKGIRRLIEKDLIYRCERDDWMCGEPAGTHEVYRLTAGAVHVLAENGGYRVGKKMWVVNRS